MEWNYKRLWKEGQRVSACVVDVGIEPTVGSGSMGGVYAGNVLTYEFTDKSGRCIRKRVAIEIYPRPSSRFLLGLKVGDNFNVVYQPNKPANNFIEMCLQEDVSPNPRDGVEHKIVTILFILFIVFVVSISALLIGFIVNHGGMHHLLHAINQ